MRVRNLHPFLHTAPELSSAVQVLTSPFVRVQDLTHSSVLLQKTATTQVLALMQDDP